MPTVQARSITLKTLIFNQHLGALKGRFRPASQDKRKVLSSKTQRAAVCSSRSLRGLNYKQALLRGQQLGNTFLWALPSPRTAPYKTTHDMAFRVDDRN